MCVGVPGVTRQTRVSLSSLPLGGYRGSRRPGRVGRRAAMALPHRREAPLSAWPKRTIVCTTVPSRKALEPAEPPLATTSSPVDPHASRSTTTVLVLAGRPGPPCASSLWQSSNLN